MFDKWIIGNPQRTRHNSQVISTREWIFLLVILFIPVANIILLFKWAFSSNGLVQESIVNFARAAIIVSAAISVAAAIIIGIFFIAQNIQYSHF